MRIFGFSAVFSFVCIPSFPALNSDSRLKPSDRCAAHRESYGASLWLNASAIDCALDTPPRTERVGPVLVLSRNTVPKRGVGWEDFDKTEAHRYHVAAGET